METEFDAMNGTSIANETLDELDIRYAHALIPFMCFLGLIGVAGIVGNILIIIVFLRGKEYRKSNFKVFVLSLAVTDLFTCTTVIPMEIFKTWTYFNYHYVILCKVKCAFNIFSLTTAALILFVICIDRYRITCRQFKRQIRQKMAKAIILTVIFVSMVLSTPAGILCGTADGIKYNLQGYNITVTTCQAEKRYQSSILRYLYKYFMALILCVVAISFIVMYVCIMRKIYKHWRKPSLGSSVRMGDLVTKTPSSSTATGPVPDQQSDSEDVFQPSENENKVNSEDKNKSKSSKKHSQNKSASTKRKPVQSVSSVTSNGSYSLSWIFRHRRSSSGTSGRISYKTVIWFILTLIFLLTYIVNASLSFLSSSVHQFSPGIMCLYQMFSRLHYINNCINVFVYAIVDRRFKPYCKELFTKQIADKKMRPSK
ncbi:hypothetical protein ACF0H5_009068 [Mactra antiquata]